MPDAEVRPDLRGVTLLLHGDLWPGLRPGDRAVLQIRRVEDSGLEHRVRVHGRLFDGHTASPVVMEMWQASLPAQVVS